MGWVLGYLALVVVLVLLFAMKLIRFHDRP